MRSMRRNKVKVALGGIWHETHAFAASKTWLENFERFGGPRILSAFAGTRTPLGGFIEWAKAQNDVECVPIFFASAVPSGIVSAEAFEKLAGTLCEGIQVVAPDMVLLDLHGAMAVENCCDVEGELLARLRDKPEGLSIGAVLDFHANISADFVDLVDILAGYDTYPHVDHFDRGKEVADLTYRMHMGEVRPTRALVQPPLMVSPQAQLTDAGPMSVLMRRAAEWERLPGVRCAMSSI